MKINEPVDAMPILGDPKWIPILEAIDVLPLNKILPVEFDSPEEAKKALGGLAVRLKNARYKDRFRAGQRGAVIYISHLPAEEDHV